MAQQASSLDDSFSPRKSVPSYFCPSVRGISWQRARCQRPKMCKEHITNSADNLRPLLWHSLMSVDVAIVDTEGVLLDLGYFTYIYVMAFPLIFD